MKWQSSEKYLAHGQRPIICAVPSSFIGNCSGPREGVCYLEAFAPVSVMFAEAQFEAGADIILWGDHVSGISAAPKPMKVPAANP